MSRNLNFGRLDRGEVETGSGFMAGSSGSTQVDIYRFNTGTARENVSISSGSIPSSPGFIPGNGSINGVFGLQLFRDANADGLVNGGDSFVLSSDGSSDNGNVNESMNVSLTQGDYIARFQGFPVRDISYSFRFARARTGGANPLADPEISVGTLSQDLRKQSKISDTNTADNYAFTLDGSSSLDITATELRNKRGDVNIRVIRDLNNNQVVDRNELVARGVGPSNSNIDTISGLSGPGNYILQVCQTKGKSTVGIVFDHSTL
jgi:hypothetical protein